MTVKPPTGLPGKPVGDYGLAKRAFSRKMTVWEKKMTMDLSKYLRDVPDFPKPGILFKDITPLLADTCAFQETIKRLVGVASTFEYDAILAAESRGFLFAAPMAMVLGKPLIPLRKPGKLPWKTINQRYDLEYGSAELQMHEDALAPGMRGLLVDDVLATGGTIGAAVDLVKKAGAIPVAALFVLELSFLNGKKFLEPLPTRSLITI